MTHTEYKAFSITRRRLSPPPQVFLLLIAVRG